MCPHVSFEIKRPDRITIVLIVIQVRKLASDMILRSHAIEYASKKINLFIAVPDLTYS